MKIAIRAGHNKQATGASALIDEVLESRRILPIVIEYLKKSGHNVLDVTPGNMDSKSDLAYGVNKANSFGADLFLSIHFNKAYDSYNGSIGSEVLVYSNHDIAEQIVKNFGILGFKNRGQKIRKELYELKNTKMKSVIVECLFVEATEDVALYKKLGVEKIALAIAEGINKKAIDVSKNPSNENILKGKWHIDDIDIREKEGIILKGWMTDPEFTLVINNNIFGTRACNVKRDDVKKVIGIDGYGFDIGIVKEALKKGLNKIELKGKTTIVTYSCEWLW
jgi:hypothetical protein